MERNGFVEVFTNLIRYTYRSKNNLFKLSR